MIALTMLRATRGKKLNTFLKYKDSGGRYTRENYCFLENFRVSKLKITSFYTQSFVFRNSKFWVEKLKISRFETHNLELQTRPFEFPNSSFRKFRIRKFEAGKLIGMPYVPPY